MINHRGPEFAAMFGRIESRLKGWFGTENDIVLLTAAGTGALEAAIVNTLSPGDRVLAVTIGAFGDRFARIAAAFGADVTKLAPDWGRAAEPALLRDVLGRDPGYRAILLTHNETSTGVTNPIPELAAVARELAPDALLLVDGISALGAVPFDQDAWGLDVVVSGSQKSWMAAPGMSFASVSERAWVAAETARMPRFYFDFAQHRPGIAAGSTPWTPAVAVLFQLDVALELMEREGVGAIFARHATCAAAVRAGLLALAFELFADQRYASNTVTAVKVPDGMDWKAFNGELRKRRLVVAGGQGKLQGQVFRIGHLGSVTLDEILGAVGVIEEALAAVGRPVVPGTGVAAAQRTALEAAIIEGVVA
jgi:aspartate aminotransferase-like enzyme